MRYFKGSNSTATVINIRYNPGKQLVVHGAAHIQSDDPLLGLKRIAILLSGYSEQLFQDILWIVTSLAVKHCTFNHRLYIIYDLIQWNLSYPNPLGPEVVHKSEKSISLKLYK